MINVCMCITMYVCRVWCASSFPTEWCGWEGEVTWPRVLSLLSFPLTNPAAMLTLAAQVSPYSFFPLIIIHGIAEGSHVIVYLEMLIWMERNQMVLYEINWKCYTKKMIR